MINKMKLEIRILHYDRWAGPALGIRGKLFNRKFVWLIPLPNWLFYGERLTLRLHPYHWLTISFKSYCGLTLVRIGPIEIVFISVESIKTTNRIQICKLF
jgi:hypothetical protein